MGRTVHFFVFQLLVQQAHPPTLNKLFTLMNNLRLIRSLAPASRLAGTAALKI